VSSGRRLSPTMDRFIAAQFIGPFLACMGGFTAGYLLSDVFDRFGDLVEYGGLNMLGIQYFLLKLPLLFAEVMPVACLAGVLLGFAILNRTGEVLACQQLGLSRIEMAAPVLLAGAVISLLNFALRETVVPYSTRQARYLYTVELKKRQMKAVFANQRVWVRVHNGFLSADNYDPRTLQLHGVTLYQLDDRFALSGVIHTTTASWDGHRWVPGETTELSLGPGGSVKVIDQARFQVDLKPDDFGLVRLNPEEFSLWELQRYVQFLSEKGLDPRNYQVDLWLKYALPFGCLMMAALGMVLSLDPLPRNVSLARSFALALGIGFGYWLAMGLTTSLGKSGVLAPWLAAWLPNLTFSTLAAALFLVGEER